MPAKHTPGGCKHFVCVLCKPACGCYSSSAQHGDITSAQTKDVLCCDYDAVIPHVAYSPVTWSLGQVPPWDYVMKRQSGAKREHFVTIDSAVLQSASAFTYTGPLSHSTVKLLLCTLWASQVGNAIKSSLLGAALKSNNKEGARSIQVEITPTSSRISRNAVTSLSIRGHRWKRHGETHAEGKGADRDRSV